MLSNYLKVALRNFYRRRQYTLINVGGLAVALAVSLLILLFVRQQWMLDQFHPSAERIHRITTTVEGRPYASAPAPLASVLRAESPAAASVVRLQREEALLTRGGSGFQIRGFTAGSAFFDVFDGFTLDEGTPASALAQPRSVVLHPETAKRLFPNTDALGQTLRRDGRQPYTVTGVLAPPDASHIRFEALFSDDARGYRAQGADAWSGFPRAWTYVRLHQDASADELRSYVAGLFERFLPADRADAYALQVQPLSDIRFGEHHFYSVTPGANLSLTSFLILGVLGLFILIVAAFNYVNLSVARSLQRTQEIGVRMAVGANRQHVAAQFLMEAVLVALAATAVAGILLWGLVPMFNSLYFVGFQDIEPVSFQPLQDPLVLLLLIGVGGFVGLLAGAYPALVLSGFKPVEVLGRLPSGGFRLGGGLNLRKVLLTSQIALTIILTATSLTIYRQASFLANSDYGFRTHDVLTVDLQDVPYDRFRQRASRLPGVTSVSATDPLPLRGNPVRYEIGKDETPIQAYHFDADTRFITDGGVSLLAAQDAWTSRFTSGQAVLINQAAADALDWDRPEAAVGQTLVMTPRGAPSPEAYTVAGVTENYHFQNKRLRVRPMVMQHRPQEATYALIHVDDTHAPAAVRADLETAWESFNTMYPLNVGSMEEVIAMQTGPITDAAYVISTVAGLAILVALLGMLGLAAYIVETRMKELAIHKAVGASSWNVTWLVSKDFAVLLAVSVLLSVPVAWLLNERLLQLFAYRVELGGVTFGVIVLSLVGLSALVVGSQAARAASQDPARVLQTEGRAAPAGA